MITLVNMPFCSLAHPSLALSLFKAQLAEAGLTCRMENLNFAFARLIGMELFESIAQRRGVDHQFGEWFFARDAWRGEVDADLARYGSSDLTYPVETLNRIRDEVVPSFLDSCCDLILADTSVRIVAFSCSYFQTLPALALARRIKERSPAVKILFGGPNFHLEMGEELMAKTGWIDVVATSEADDLIIPLCQRLLSGADVDGLQGLAWRTAAGELKCERRPAAVTSAQLEALPDPDYTDYFAELEAFDAPNFKMIRDGAYLPFEGSRGCWWGEKSHCTFCGLNPTGMKFRSKSPARVLATLNNFADRYPSRRFFATDNNMPLDFFETLWPELVGSKFSSNYLIYYEVKPNLGRNQLRILSEAGVRFIQPGIENLSTHLLSCMRKGLSGLIHVHFLKLCRIFSIWPCWNFLVGIPGELQEDYQRLARLIPLISHFTPPRNGIMPLQLHRFSPYYNESERYLDRFSPSPWYSTIYPAERVDLDRMAYFFEAEWKDTLGSRAEDYPELNGQVNLWLETWQKARQLPALTYELFSGSRLELADRRLGRNGLWKLDARESAIYRSIDDPNRPVDIAESSDAGSVDQIAAILNDFVRAGLAIEEGGRYLGLAIPDSTPSFTFTERRLLFPKPWKKCQA